MSDPEHDLQEMGSATCQGVVKSSSVCRHVDLAGAAHHLRHHSGRGWHVLPPIGDRGNGAGQSAQYEHTDMAVLNDHGSTNKYDVLHFKHVSIDTLK